MPASRRKHLFIGLFVTSASTILCLVVLELALHWLVVGRLIIAPLTPSLGLMEPHPVRGWTPRPGVDLFIHTIDYAVTAHTNRNGLYDLDYPYEKPPGVFRIVMLGDSFLSTEYVELTAGLPFLLEGELGPHVDVINLGVTGYGTAQEYLYLRDEGLRYQPDLVLLAFYPLNDLRNNYEPLETRVWGEDDFSAYGRPYATIQNGDLTFRYPDVARIGADMEARRRERMQLVAQTPWYERTMTWAVSRDLVFGRNRIAAALAFDPAVYYGPYLAHTPGSTETAGFDYDQAWAQAWEITSALLAATNDLAVAEGVRFAIFTVPAKMQVDENYRAQFLAQYPEMEFDLTKYETLAKRIAEEHGFPFLDLLPAFVAAQPERGLYFRADEHWNATGNRVAATALARLLREQGLVSAPGPPPAADGG